MKTRDNAEVVIIGAGAAGLSAARSLARAGKRVTIVEARARIGGRIYTQHAASPINNASSPAELGAEFVHGLPAASWSLIREAKLATIELQGERFCFEDRQLQLCGESQHESFKVLERMEAWLELLPRGSDGSFEDYLQGAHVEAASANRASAYVEGFNAADRHVISATALVRQQRAEDRLQGDRIFHIRAGYEALPAYLADCLSRAGATLLLDCPVRAIHWRRNAVRVQGRSANGAEFCVEAPQAVITLPLGVLQANDVNFDPLPLAIAQHCSALMMGQVERITLLFDRRFWDDKAGGLSFLFAPGETFPTWWTTMPESMPMITGWASGASALSAWQRAGIAGADAVKSAALQTLTRMFGVAAADLQRWLLSAHYHDWRHDEFSRGAYSYVKVGGMQAARALSVPIDETLFFAGEHIDLDDQWGTVHGALASGLRAATQLLERAPRRS